METLEFLGGKYNGGEQILPGAIQAYRATESLTGRPVFVHRVSSEDDVTQQLTLYRLLAAALVRSPSVRSMILDMRDEGNDWYVVTETAPQCLLLREWLQFELGNSAKASDATKVGPIQPAPPAPVHKDTQPVPPAVARLGEPGEFTRFFQNNQQGPSTKTSGGERVSSIDQTRAQERPVRSGIVQRPNTPMPFIPPTAPRSAESGEFTRIFSKEGSSASWENQKPSLERPAGSADSQDLFRPYSEPAGPVGPAAPQPGEYTQIFGKGDTLPPVGERSGLKGNAQVNYNDPLPTPAAVKRNEHEPGVAAAAPSEYTRLFGNGQSLPTNTPAKTSSLTPEVPPAPFAKPSGATAIQGISASPATANPRDLGQVHVPQTSAPKVAVPPLPPPVSKIQPSTIQENGGNKKLIMFFGVLGVLALLIILLVVLALKK